jgi:hypothetical protein
MRILITRTAPFHVFERAINKLREEFPNSDITIMVQSSFKYQIEKYQGRLKTVIIPDGSFRLSKKVFTLIKDIRKDRFDILVLLYNNPPGRGYLSLDIFGVLTGINKVMIYDVGGNFYEVSSKLIRVIKKLFANITGRLIYIFMKAVIFIWGQGVKNLQKSASSVG